jgi:dihydroorotase
MEIIQPDDMHHHFRDGDALKQTVPAAARQFARVLAMPNLKPPVTTTEMALQYYDRLMVHAPENSNFRPLMTLYMTDKTPPEEIVKAKESGKVVAVKLYPAGATTNSDSGVTNIDLLTPTLEKMAELGILLLIHGEVTTKDIDIFDREAKFIETKLKPLVEKVPNLKIVLEHCTTKQAVDFVMAAPDHVGATITPQHLLYNRNAIFDGGVRPHMYCLPILKREEHRQALLGAISSGSPKFFLGTDSAPHAKHTKESSCGCAGCFSAYSAIELYAEAFESVDCLNKLENFASVNGAKFYGLDVNTKKVKLEEKTWVIPESVSFGDHVVVPLRAGTTCKYKLNSN